MLISQITCYLCVCVCVCGGGGGGGGGGEEEEEERERPFIKHERPWTHAQKHNDCVASLGMTNSDF